ncbi:MAG TPA: universal stress protein [Cyclobacteriaceae bacterium]|nr:universal stress protein [Cyclobacteriaceae bacterium]HMV10016.1 universal stress protein [Cyclobacteriaceae bacterium]HMV90565.1 universal stress protein [Cyclobacteriaceae bacterium]HMW99787.1 universal stress protein [Cyclobacteriaceae bacterium]HMX50179.1 universal stress protein [Cyclobacteriaceae bacterium]
MNILVPTDFSKLSLVAIEYAISMANRINGSVTLLHVMDNFVKPTRASMQEEAKAISREASVLARQRFEPIVAEAEKLSKTGNPIVVKIRKGRSFSNTVRLFAKRNQIELIVMGTKGASGLSKYVLGSNTVSVMDASRIPVLAVPSRARFNNFKNIIYAADLKYLESEIGVLKPYLKLLDATLHVLHVCDKTKSEEELQNKVKSILKQVDYRKSTVMIKSGKPIDRVIDSYVKELKADMVAMFTHKRTAYENLFHRSVTKKMAFQSHVPLLAFKNK